jgi:hypothetical protein
MAQSFERLDNEPIFVITIADPYDFVNDPPVLFAQIAAETQTISGKYISIYDLRGLTVNFSDMVMGMAVQAKGGAGSIADSHNVTLVVATSDRIKFAVEAFKQPQYGNLQIPMFETMDEAIAQARHLLMPA